MAKWRGPAEPLARPSGRPTTRERLAKLTHDEAARAGMSTDDLIADSLREFLTTRHMWAELTAWEKKHPAWPIIREAVPRG